MLHAHVVPRYACEPPELRRGPVWSYDQAAAPRFDPAVHGELQRRIARELARLAVTVLRRSGDLAVFI